MHDLSTTPKWPLCMLAATLAACAEPASNNMAAEFDRSGQAAAPAAGTAAADANLLGQDRAAAAPAAKAPPGAPAGPAAAPAPESYSALGQEPGWALRIGGGRIDYSGNYGDKKINVARPQPQPIPNGRRYVTPRLTVTLTYERCNDAMSGLGFEHRVKVVADGETYEGCGGARKKEWDM